MNFEVYTGDAGELRTNENYWVFKWERPGCHVLFSATQQGKAATCHFSSDRAGLRMLKDAINEWCEFCFWLFDWCKMVVGIIERPSVQRLAQKCGFEPILINEVSSIFIRRR